MKKHLQIVKQLYKEIDLTLNRTDRNKIMRDRYKSIMGCVECGFNQHPCALQFDHIDPSTKFRDSKGNLVNPSDMVRQDTNKMLDEYAKCRVMCANCHAIHTHTVQRKSGMSVADVRLVA